MGTTHCFEVVPDRRFKTSVRLHFMNDLVPRQQLWGPGPGGSRRQTPESTKQSLTNFEAWSRSSPRISIEWINTGSVWRRLPSYPQDYVVGGSSGVYVKHVFLDDLVVVDTINSGGRISLARIERDGTLERYHDSYLRGSQTLTHFMRRYARVWLLGGRHPETPDAPEELFPELLYRHQFLTDPENEGLVFPEVVAQVAPPPPPPKPKKPRKRRKRKPKKPEAPRRSIWERLMADEE